MKRIIVLFILALSIATGYAQTQNLENVIVRNKLTVGDSTLSTGNVGISTKNPTQKLDVNGGLRVRNLGAGIVVSNASGVLSVDSTLTADSLSVNYLIANTVRINRDSFTDPAATIASVGNSGNIVECFTCDTIQYLLDNVGGYSPWDSLAGNVFLKDSTDNVGIGTSAPIVKLELQGGFFHEQTSGDYYTSITSATEAGSTEINTANNANSTYTRYFADHPSQVLTISAGSTGVASRIALYPTGKASIIADTLQVDIPSAAAGYVLTSLDADGNTTWQDPNAYGEMGFGDSTRTIALTQNVFSVVTNSNNTLWSTAAVDLHNVTYSGDSLIIDSAGTYQVNIQLSMDGTSGSIIRLGVFLNGVLACTCTGYQELLNNRILQLTYINIDALNAGDVLQVVITNTANGDDVDAVGGKLMVNRIR